MIKDLAAFQKAEKTRNEVYRGINKEPVTDDEDDHITVATELADPPQVTPQLSSPLILQEPTLEDDEEPDDIFPEPTPNEKGLKIDKITLLKQDGGILNYRVWLNELDNVFESDRARYTTATKRVTFASMQMDDHMKSLWASRIQTHPHLR